MSSIFPTFTPCLLPGLVCGCVVLCALSSLCFSYSRFPFVLLAHYARDRSCTCTCTFCTVVYGAYTIHVQYNVHVDTHGFCLPIF